MRTLKPLPASASFEERIDWVSCRDPLGHRVHLYCALIALFMIPLSSSLATIGSTILIVYAALRAPTLRYAWAGLQRNGCLILIIALFAWLLLSLTWSPDGSHGARLLRGSRYMLLVPALLPLLRHAHLLLYALCAGVFLQVFIQLLQFVSGGSPPLGGLDGHPGNTGIWFTLAIGILLTLPAGDAGASMPRKFAAIIPVLGILMTAARSVMLGAVAGMLAIIVRAAIRPGRERLWTIAVGIVLIACLVIPSLSGDSAIGSRIKGAWSALDRQVAEDGQQEDVQAEQGAIRQDQTRMIWWRIGLDAWKADPIVGAGLGSAGRDIREDDEVRELTSVDEANRTLLRDDYHSLFVSVTAQGGSIGLILLAAWLILLARQVLASEKLGAILLMGLVSYLVYSVFNTTLFTGRLVAFSAVLMAFSTCQIPVQMTIAKATEPPGTDDDV